MTKEQFILKLFMWQKAHFDANLKNDKIKDEIADLKEYEQELLTKIANEIEFYNELQKKALIKTCLETDDTLGCIKQLIKLFDSKERLVYIVTRCSNEQNYTPASFKSYDDAYSYMKKAFDKERGSSYISENISKTSFSRASALIEYKDETYDLWQIHQCLQEN